MKSKGFTLIELLAVIVILAIIALIATPIILGIINDTRESADLASARNYMHAIELSLGSRKDPITAECDVVESDVEEEGEKKAKKGDLSCNSTYISVDVSGNTAEAGKIYISDNQILKIENLKIGNSTFNIDESGNYHTVVSCSVNRAVDGAITMGDLVTCGNEKFYVLSSSDSTTKMITEKNIELKTSNAKQSSSAGTIAFSNKTSWNMITQVYINDDNDEYSVYQENGQYYYDDDNDVKTPITADKVTDKIVVERKNVAAYLQNTKIKQYLDSYNNYLHNLGVGINKINLFSQYYSILAQSSDFTNLGCEFKEIIAGDVNSINCDGVTFPSWLKNTSSWTGQVNQDGKVYVLTSSGLSTAMYNVNDTYGIRPVVEINTSLLK